MSKPRYRFALMLNGTYLYPWQRKVLESIEETQLAECCLLIIRKNPPLHAHSLLSKLANKHLLFERYKRLRLNPTLYKAGHLHSLDHVKQMYAEPLIEKKNHEYLSAADIAQIKELNLDFILRFGFGILKKDILQAAKWGVWSFHHGNEQEYRGGPAGFWEISKNAETVGTILQQLTERLDAGKIILKRTYQVVQHSYRENLGKILVHSADMPAQALRMIDAGQMDPSDWENVKTQAPVYHYPTNFQFLRFCVQMGINKFRFRWNKWLRQENWVVGYKQENQDHYSYLSPAKDGEYFADPFIFHHKGAAKILAEHYSYKSKKGNIVILTPGTNHFITALSKKNHLAYPFVFEEDGETYMLPEESETGKLNLYKWDPVEETFREVKSILAVPAVDASVLKHKGKYFIFTGIRGQLPNEKLFLFYSDQLEGPYHPHPANPIKTDPKGSRMAGGFIKDKDTLIRPAQYSVRSYGEKVIFHRITDLSDKSYAEAYLNELAPFEQAPFRDGLHTFHKNDTLEVIDLKRMRSDLTAFLAQL